MLKLALLLAMSQVDEDLPFPPDPFDHSLPPLSVNDTDPKASKEPSFLHVGICVGTDINQSPIMIADRLCMNREATEILSADVSSQAQDMVKLSNENERLSLAIAEQRSGLLRAAAIAVSLILLSFVGGYLVGARESN